MVSFPNCKINLGLNILRKREDGFHDLETIFYPLLVTDVLEIIRNPDQDAAVVYSSSGLPIEGKTENNLCIKAWHLLKKDHPALPSIKLHLHKAIPMGAGLGGGSSDGAFTLKMLNDKFELGLDTEQLTRYAAELGSDGPFFILNQPAFASGRGEQLDSIELDLSNYHIALVNPGIHVNTGWAFSKLNPALPQKSIRDIIQQPIGSWKDELVNDFERPVMKEFPAIQKIKDELYKMGALYASMSGSGSSVYGIFNAPPDCTVFETAGYYCRVISRLSR